MFRKKPDDVSIAVYALLSIWICVIIFTETGQKGFRQTFLEKEAPRVLILDPGHGGLDGGAVSVTGTCESRINWDIALRCRDMAGFFGIPAVMTRPSYEIDYPEELKSIASRKKWDTRSRVEFADGVAGGMLLSIHQNCYPSASPHGLQVLYAPDEKSRALAEIVQKAFAGALPKHAGRSPVQADRRIYLLNQVSCPAILVECGFLSNPEEAARLETADYQKTLAMVMIHAICQGWE